jgi:hypothetical protein
MRAAPPWLLGLALALPVAAADGASAPRSATYSGGAGKRGTLSLYVNKGVIDLAAIKFACGRTTGSTGLNYIVIKRVRGVYRFGIRAHGGISYADDHVDQNGSIEISGHFSSSGASARGTLRVRTPRCRKNQSVRWSVHR